MEDGPYVRLCVESFNPQFHGSVGNVAAGALEALSQGSNETERAFDALNTLAELQSLLETREGYVRVGTDAAGLFYVRWKWTAGSLAGRYTFGSGQSLGAAVEAALANVSAVLAGKLKATMDTPPRRR